MLTPVEQSIDNIEIKRNPTVGLTSRVPKTMTSSKAPLIPFWTVVNRNSAFGWIYDTYGERAREPLRTTLDQALVANWVARLWMDAMR
jgi:hypothetical protein